MDGRAGGWIRGCGETWEELKDQGDRGREGRNGSFQNRKDRLLRGHSRMLFLSHSGIFSSSGGTGKSRAERVLQVGGPRFKPNVSAVRREGWG